ncbi:helix-turn-helix transcriptional regulator [Nitratireductor sp. ZSWI3]|uniref:ArsR/SmtB family transcription factor n=1 Tax=Nitratireductor sp. ZSWI3 TaxID=2966359 RepID=UPI00215067AB|nr:metalloregulator ArsR/SmtB family transcription factor [Nitratireductor sp. ZSWI3]MCR4266870.1 metalloregulator ArsR/SmtB family transcription factor [Nitratireductor sp. ZSWI3]
MKHRSTSEFCCAHAPMALGLAALSHPARIEILRHLSGLDASCCKDVVGHLRLAQSTVSQHLKVLVEAGLLRMRPERQSSRYEVDVEALKALSDVLAELADACAAARTRSDAASEGHLNG